MKFKNILINENNGIATITVNRPKKLNALNNLTILELDNAFKQLEKKIYQSIFSNRNR